MTALARPRMVGIHKVIRTLDLPLAADVVIFKGALCGIKAGYLTNWVDGDVDIKHPCIAIPDAEVVDNTGGIDGALSCPVDFYRERILYVFANDVAPNAITQAQIGGDAWGADDQTVSALSTGRSRVGTPFIVRTTASRGWRVGVYVELGA